MADVPALSVIIAAYNAQETIGAQLDALRRQDVPFAWEVLVCDNGSDDDTAKVVVEATESMPHLRLVDASRRRGPGAARNEGARRARAPWLAFCDADDVVDDDWVGQMHTALTTYQFITGRSRRPELNSPPGAPRYFDWSTYRLPFFPYLDGAGAGNMAIHKAVFDEAGGFDESLRTGEDLDLCWRVQLAGHALVTHEDAVVNVSNREGLRASFLQAFTYGVGNKRLRHKYALVIQAFRQKEADPAVHHAQPPSQADGGRVRTLARKFVRLRRLSDLTDVTHRTAMELGFRWGVVDRRRPQLKPPPVLPAASSGR